MNELNASNLLKTKYKNSLKLYDEMTSNSPFERPTCEDIINRIRFWAMNEHEFKIDDEIRNLIISEANKKTFSIYYMIRTKIIYPRVDSHYGNRIAFTRSFSIYDKNLIEALIKSYLHSSISFVRDEGQIFARKKIEYHVDNKADFINEFMNHIFINKMICRESEYFFRYRDSWIKNFDEEKIVLCFEMELADASLDNVINEIYNDSNFSSNGILSVNGFYIASQIFIQILEAVKYLHYQNPPLVHGNLNPSNILFKKGFRSPQSMKIADFGLLEILFKYSDDFDFEVATFEHMASEVLLDNLFSLKSDIYSLGIIFGNLFGLKTDG